MATRAGAAQPAQPELYAFLLRALSLLRWVTLLALLVIAVAQPTEGWGGVPVWGLVLVFAGYNLVVEVLRLRLSARRFLMWMSILDLPLAAILYFVAGEAGGLLFVLFFLAIDSAAASMTLRGTLLYMTAVTATAITAELLIRFGTPTAPDIRMAGARLVMLVLVGALVALLTRRLNMESETARTVRDEAERLETLDRLRGDFLAGVSHDLRTPLTAARAALRLIEVSAGDRLRPDEHALLENGRRNVERLDLLIGDLLALNQLESGTLRLVREPVDLRDVARAALAGVRPLFDERGQTLATDLPEPLPLWGDGRRLEQVLVNLLENVYRHTPTGTHVVLSGRLTANEVRLAVWDNGPGIPAVAREAIFTRFYRLTPATVAAGGGSGLGLAIAKGIIDLHGGRIWADSADSADGGGTVFHIALPRSVETESDADAATERSI